MPRAWISNGDACVLGLTMRNCDEFDHRAVDISTRAFRTLWGAGRGQDREGAPLLARDGRICFFYLSLLTMVAAAAPKLSLLPVELLTTLLGGISARSPPRPTKGPAVNHEHVQHVKTSLEALLQSEFPYGEDPALRDFAKQYVKSVQSLVRRKEGHHISSAIDSIEAHSVSMESNPALSQLWNALSAAQKQRINHFQREVYSVVSDTMNSTSDAELLTSFVFTAGIGAVSALVLWWYNDRERFQNIWNWALGRVPVPEFTPSAPLSQRFQRQLEKNVRLATEQEKSPPARQKYRFRNPSRHVEEPPRDVAGFSILNETIAEWWNIFYSWTRRALRQAAMSSALHAAVPSILLLAVVAVAFQILCGPSCRWLIGQGYNFLVFLYNIFPNLSVPAVGDVHFSDVLVPSIVADADQQANTEHRINEKAQEELAMQLPIMHAHLTDMMRP